MSVRCILCERPGQMGHPKFEVIRANLELSIARLRETAVSVDDEAFLAKIEARALESSTRMSVRNCFLPGGARAHCNDRGRGVGRFWAAATLAGESIT